MDPLAEEYYSYSPYNYVLNNPLIFIDPDGEDVYWTGSDGNIYHFETEDQSEDYFFLQNSKGETTFLGGFQKNKDGLIQLPSSYSFTDLDFGTSFSFNVKSGNESRSYVRGDALAALFGALAETDTKDLTVVGFSNSDGSSPKPSKSHKDGKNGDLRYLRKDKSGGSLLLQDQQMDIERQNTFNEALYKYGWTDMLSENFVPYGEKKSTRLKRTRHYSKSRHHNHLHLQGFKPKVKKMGKICGEYCPR